MSMAIPDYELLELCGRGAYGEVWIARSRSGRLVALKTLERPELMEKEFAGLVNYSRIRDCAHLVRILHIGETPEGLYYTMELADSLGSDTHYEPATLANLLRQKKRLSPKETRQLGDGILDGLATLHAARLLHRDVKPENILFVDGVPQLSDVGLVRSATRTLSIAGTLGFIPPEHLRSGSSGKERSDDLYAMGKVLYCCLSGNSVDEFPSFPPELISQKEYRELNQVILTACDPKRACRFKNAREFQQALKRGVSRKKRLFSWMYHRYYLWLLPAVVAGVLLSRPQTEPALKIGAVSRMKELNLIAYGKGVLYMPQTGDILHRDIRKLELDGAPRRKKLICSDDFSSARNWNVEDGLGFTFFDHSLIVGNRGTVWLNDPLPSNYAISFDVDCSGLNGDVRFRVTMPGGGGGERASYQWTLYRRSDGRFMISPLEYQPENGKMISFEPGSFSGNIEKMARVEMLQTENLFRVYINGELVLYVPSLFFGGKFGIAANEERDAGYCRISNFQVFSIPRDAGCPVPEQYHLPERKRVEEPPRPPQPAIEITRERLQYLARTHTSGAIAQVFGTDEPTIVRALDEHELFSARLTPGSRTRQPRSRLTAREIENLRRKLSEL